MTDQDLFVSEQVHKDKEADLQKAKESLAGPVPLMKTAPVPFITLPRGLFVRGTWQKEVEVRELTGGDEETLAKAKDTLNFFSTVLALGVTRIGDTDVSATPLTERRYHLGQLLIGEREQLFFKIIEVSFGDEKPIFFTCRSCNEDNEVTLLLSEDFKPKEVESPESILLAYTTSKGDVLDLRPAVGDDQEEALSRKGASLAEQNTIMLSRCITKVNGGLVVDPTAFARNLGIRDRQKILQLLVERQPSISLDIDPTCTACGTEQRLALTWGDIFRP